MTSVARNTPLYSHHVAAGARMVDYAGWSMPVMYSSILDEARSVRSSAGIFDISHMGRIQVTGSEAAAFLQRLTSNDISSLADGKAHYSLLTNPMGGIIDDIIVYRQNENSFLVVINAGNTAKDLSWMESQRPDGVEISDYTSTTAMIALQGPHAPGMLAEIAGSAVIDAVGRFEFVNVSVAGVECTACRTGYTGEDGFELILAADSAGAIWDTLVQAGAAQCGLGARDALRIEAGYPLYGHEIDDTTSPVDAGLMWVVRLGKGDFIGATEIAQQKATGPKRKLVGLVSSGRIQARQGNRILSDGLDVGEITSGIFSPTRNVGIAMGYVASETAKPGARVEIAVREKLVPATIVSKKSLLATTGV